MTAAGRAYFRYHFRSKWKLLLCMVVVSLVFTVLICAGGQEYSYIHYEDDVKTLRVIYNSTLGISFTTLLVAGCLIPITEFKFFKKRRNLDCVYGLPITRREMGVIHYITGLICVIVPYTCAYLANFLLLLRYPEGFYFPPVLGYYFLSLLMGICAYSINVFLFNQANTTGDGIWFMLGWTFLLSSLAGVWNTIIWEYYVYPYVDTPAYDAIVKFKPEKLEIDTFMGYSWGALSEIQYIYADVIEKAEDASLHEMWGNKEYVAWFVLWIVLGVSSVVGFVCSFGKRRTEKTEEVSDSWFGFKLLIPLYAVLMSISGAGAPFSTIFAFIGYVIYRKGFHLKKSDWILMIVVFLLSIVCSVVFADTLLGIW